MTDGTGRPEMSIRSPYLRLIASGTKKVEVRVGYPTCARSRPGKCGQRVPTE